MEQVACYQFCPGKPFLPETGWSCKIGMFGYLSKLQMAPIPLDCLSLVGPDDIAAWNMMLEFPGRKYRIDEREQDIVRATNGLSCVSLVDFSGFTTNHPLTVGGLFLYGQFGKPHRGRCWAGGQISGTEDTRRPRRRRDYRVCTLTDRCSGIRDGRRVRDVVGRRRNSHRNHSLRHGKR